MPTFPKVGLDALLTPDNCTGTDQIVHMIKNIAIIGGLFNLIAF